MSRGTPESRSCPVRESTPELCPMYYPRRIRPSHRSPQSGRKSLDMELVLLVPESRHMQTHLCLRTMGLLRTWSRLRRWSRERGPGWPLDWPSTSLPHRPSARPRPPEARVQSSSPRSETRRLWATARGRRRRRTAVCPSRVSSHLCGVQLLVQLWAKSY